MQKKTFLIFAAACISFSCATAMNEKNRYKKPLKIITNKSRRPKKRKFMTPSPKKSFFPPRPNRILTPPAKKKDNQFHPKGPSEYYADENIIRAAQSPLNIAKISFKFAEDKSLPLYEREEYLLGAINFLITAEELLNLLSTRLYDNLAEEYNQLDQKGRTLLAEIAKEISVTKIKANYITPQWKQNKVKILFHLKNSTTLELTLIEAYLRKISPFIPGINKI